MKYEFGLCTNRFSLCFRFSDSGVGLSRSTANYQRIGKGRLTHDSATNVTQPSDPTFHFSHNYHRLKEF